MELEVGAAVGGYRVEEVLGRGGMGTVYRARHVEHGRLVALKLVAPELGGDPDFAERFRREGRLQASLEHPHVVTVLEAGASEHGLYLAMRLVEGPTLAALMQARALDAVRVLGLLRQVADALDAAHAAGLVHRDVKPQNVLVGEPDDAYLGDFGLTRLGGAGGVTATGRLVGTVSYLAPEVIRGGEATPASDRYAFAAMAFEALTGTTVFPRKTEAALLFAHTSEPPPRASGRRAELPRALDDVLARALAKDPAERPSSAAALLEEIAGAFGGAELAALGPPPPPGAAALEEQTIEPLPRRLQHPEPSAAPPRRRALAPALLGAAFAGAAVVAGVVALADDGGDRAAAAGTAAPAPLSRTETIGSFLAEGGRPLDCRGRPPGPASQGCTIIQSALPGRTLVVPEDGVIRRWGVRSARGELGLAVVRRRGEETFQIARSRNEFVGNAGVHLFHTDLAVERGDLVGLVLLPGSAAGARRDVEGAATDRWMGPAATGRPLARGWRNELLLRVEYLRGGQQELPEQVAGTAAASLEPGRVVRRSRLRFGDGRRVEIVLVAVDGRFAVDQFLTGRRTARIDVPGDMRPGGGRVVKWLVARQPADDQAIGIYVEYARTGSARLLNHYFSAFPREFEFVN